MSRRNRTSEMMRSSTIQRLTKYFHPPEDPEAIAALQSAYNREDPDALRRELLKLTAEEEAMENVMSHYDFVMFEVASDLLEKAAKKTLPGKLGIKRPRRLPVSEAPEVPAAPPPPKQTIRKAGKTYTRMKPTPYTIAEKAWLKRRLHTRHNQKLWERYVQVFGEKRTIKALANAKYRMKKT